MENQTQILIVDDDRNTCEALQDFLEDEGYEILCANEGLKGVELSKQKRPAVVLLDLKLPDITGIEVLRKLKEDREDLMVIMMSGHASLESAIEAMNAGAYTYLRKPVNTEELLIVLERALEKRALKKKIKQLISDLKKSNKLKDEFLGICSHDIKNPLATIVLSLDSLINIKDKKEVERSRDVIARQTNKILSLINDLLDITNLEAGGFSLQKKKISVKDFCLEIVRDQKSLAQSKNLSLECDTISSDLEVWADPMRLEQVLKNLLSNAMKFSKKGGRIIISAKQTKIFGNDCIEFSVEDNGMGIPKEKQKKLFDKFVQAREKDRQMGTGLGLAICKEICELHKGKIWVESEEGKGAKFSFTVPLNEPAEKKAA